jgi:hypothetical protein
MSFVTDETDLMPRCLTCRMPLPEARQTGRPRRYCLQACRQRRYLRRLNRRTKASIVLETDLKATPSRLASLIVEHFQPEGTALDPARGDHRPFWQALRGMTLADNIVYLAPFALFVSYSGRLAAIDEAGFRLREALLLPQPPPPWIQSCRQLAAVWLARGWKGPLEISRSHR